MEQEVIDLPKPIVQWFKANLDNFDVSESGTVLPRLKPHGGLCEMQFVCLISHPPISVNIPGGGIHEMGGGARQYYTYFTKQVCATQTFVFKMQVQRLTHLH